MRITFEDREWDLDLEAITIKQAVAMHLAYGFTLDGWMTACGETDPRALQCLYWLMLAQDGTAVAIKDADCRIIALGLAFAEAQEEEDEEDDGEPGPTSPPSTSPDPPLSVPSGRKAATPSRQEGGRVTASTPAI